MRRTKVKILQAIALIAATLAVGVMTGVFQLYTYAIMPGLGRTDDRTFVGAFQSIDRAVINPWFMASFLGGLVFTGAAALLHLGSDVRSVLVWIVVALILYAIVFVITIAINVPLNDEIKAAGDPDRIADLAAVREQFNADKWERWNLVRALATTGALGCLAWALVLNGRNA
jgi:uncharacterized membrane protein